MMLKLLAAPVIGAIIGYCTNWLAVKMLFRPREEKYILGFKVPFTPGVIPKGKKRLAAAVCKVVNEQLLTKEAVEKKLLAPEMIHTIKSSVNERTALIKNDDNKTIRKMMAEAACPAEKTQDASDIAIYGNDSESRIDELSAAAKDFITDRVFERISNAGLGQIAADTVNEKLSQALAGSFIGHMMGGSVTQMMVPAVAQTVDSYISEHGRELIGKMVGEEVDSLLEMKAASVIENIENAGIDPGAKAAEIYATAVKKKSDEIVELLDAGGIIKETIENMDNEQLEELVMSTMKTELGAVVNFGALIGLVLGLINMLIYLI